MEADGSTRPSLDKKVLEDASHLESMTDKFNIPTGPSTTFSQQRSIGLTPSVNEDFSVPDGGLRAWLQVLGAFFLFFNSFGLINTFGIYQTYYESEALFSSTPFDISWIGSLQTFLLTFLGPLTGPLYDAGHFRLLIFCGSLLVVFGQMMLSLSTKYYQVFMAQAICIGIGTGFLYVPSVAILSTYFDKKLATATGLATSGSSLGGVIYPIVLYRLLPQTGFAWATRVLGFIALFTLLISNLVMNVRTLPVAKRKLLDLVAFKEAPYALFTLGCFIGWLGLYAPYFYIESFSISYRMGSESLSFYTLAIVNAGSTFGRLLPNYLADRTGPMNIMAPACIVCGILVLCLIPVRNVIPLIIIGTLYGFCSGALVSLYSTVYIRLSMHKRGMIGTRIGMGLLIASIGLLLGTPICGWILDASGYAFVWVFAGVMLLTGGLIMVAARIAQTKGAYLFVKA